ncbi:hypothetical protein BpHYR1_048929, partial [Brachionus plicatilis]
MLEINLLLHVIIYKIFRFSKFLSLIKTKSPILKLNSKSDCLFDSRFQSWSRLFLFLLKYTGCQKK